MKCNHGSGWNIIVHDKTQLNLAEAKKKMDIWMHSNYAFRAGLEMHYKRIRPRIVVEEYLENQNKDLYDYKLFCINGKVYMCWVDSGRYIDHKRDFFNANWEHMPVLCEYPNANVMPQKPKDFEKMKELAEKLAKGFPQVRVDFYVLNDGTIKFGEMTFTSGTGADRYNPLVYDRIIGKQIILKGKN